MFTGDRLAVSGADLLKATLVKLEAETLTSIPQNSEEATYARLLQFATKP